MKTSQPSDGRLMLMDDWKVQSSKSLPGGDQVSSPNFKPSGWYKTSLPSTVVSTLAENKVHLDPYHGMNLRQYPGMAYAIKENFALFPIPDDSPFAASWWFRKEFKVPTSSNKHFCLHFDGINFKANIWVNGKKLADQREIIGTYRHYDFDITSFARSGGPLVVAAEIFAPATPQTLAFSWIDWNPSPPDKDLGIWRDVYVTESGPVSLSNSKVVPKLDLPSLDKAHLTVEGTLRNETDQPVQGILKGKIGKIAFSQSVQLIAGETKTVTFESSQFKQLNINKPKLWWPYQMGKQDMYELNLEFEIKDKTSDSQDVRFGIREVTSEMLGGEYRLFSINGKRIQIRGAGWSPDLMFQASREREEKEIRYVRDMNLNTIRFEGPVASQHILDLCDEYGILVMAGWQCCCYWEHWKDWKPEDHPIANESLKSEIRRLFNHPSVFVWVNGSDFSPPVEVLQMYLDTLAHEKWSRPSLASATVMDTIEGKTGVKMTGPYQYIPPTYWYIDTKKGGNFGFNTETCCGPAGLPIESIKKMLPADHLWPIDDFWKYHCGGGPFSNMDIFNRALESRHGSTNSLEEYVLKSQVMVYDGHRAMFEAYRKNKYHDATGVIQWMLNNAWPSFYWHLYDYYLRPGSSYFAAKRSNEDLHIQYSYDDRSVVVSNNHYKPFKKLKAKVKLFHFDLTEAFSKETIVDIDADSTTTVVTLPEVPGITPTHFLRLDLQDKGKTISSNFYWLSAKKETMDWEKTDFWGTPVIEDADMTQLNQLPKVKVAVAAKHKKKGKEGVTTVTLKNEGNHLAFFIRLKVVNAKNKEEMLPVLWEDNYFTLMPGEKRQVEAVYPLQDLGSAKPLVEVEGWNLK